VEEIDFQAPGAADTINNWVSENTNGKIKKIIQPPIPGSMAAILLNALYLKANWSYPFDTAHTRVRPFHLGDGSEVNCDMMSKKTEDDMQSFPEYSKRPIIYFETDLFQGATLPYGKEGFRMTVLLPDLSITVDSLVGLLTPENWQAWQQLPTWDDFVLQTPKFKFEFETRLNEFLQAMGMNAAFNGSESDFSNLFVDGVGWIDEVKHKTFVQVDEKGTEAAAVTSVIFFDSLPPSMIVNRPFVFVIYEATSGAILFMGKVVNPTQES
jgi:serpin B